jgi:hypothetical protein
MGKPSDGKTMNSDYEPPLTLDIKTVLGTNVLMAK